MKKVSISEFKAHLSEYLRAAEAGESIVVCDRHRPVAQVGRPREGMSALVLRPPKHNRDLRSIKGFPPSRSVDVVALLNEDRGER